MTRAPDQWLAAERVLRQGLGERLTDSQAGLTTEPTTTTENLVTIGMLRHAKGTLAGCVPGILTQGLVGSFARRQDTLDWIGLQYQPKDRKGLSDGHQYSGYAGLEPNSHR